MFQGSYVALVTPFHEDGSVNIEKLKELCRMSRCDKTEEVVVISFSMFKIFHKIVMFLFHYLELIAAKSDNRK